MPTTLIFPFRPARVVALLAVLVAACGGEQQEMADTTMMEQEAEASLYQRLGGKEAIVAVVDDFVANVAADPRINSFFATTNIPRLKTMLVDQICAATGGPCTYTGRDMVTTHVGMGITDEHFNALVEDLVKSLDKFEVPQEEQDELLAILRTMRDEIVTADAQG